MSQYPSTLSFTCRHSYHTQQNFTCQIYSLQMSKSLAIAHPFEVIHKEIRHKNCTLRKCSQDINESRIARLPSNNNHIAIKIISLGKSESQVQRLVNQCLCKVLGKLLVEGVVLMNLLPAYS